MNVKIMVRGPEDRRAEHIAFISDDDQLHDEIGTALGLYRKFYPDAPPFRKTVEIDPVWRAPQINLRPRSLDG